jgi:hypothetical protein
MRRRGEGLCGGGGGASGVASSDPGGALGTVRFARLFVGSSGDPQILAQIPVLLHGTSNNIIMKELLMGEMRR